MRPLISKKMDEKEVIEIIKPSLSEKCRALVQKIRDAICEWARKIPYATKRQCEEIGREDVE